MSRTPTLFVLTLAASLAGASALAQTPPARPAIPAADANLDAQKAAFLALPLPTRVAAQDALVWLGLHNGVADGTFGKRTRDSIVAFQFSQKATGDGVLSGGELQALLAAGEKARAAAGFKTIADPLTGARIGAPTKLVDAKGGVTLDFASNASGDLAGLYARLAADTPTRKVAYKAMKPGAFFVVSGEDHGRTFYTRYDSSAAATPPIRGFTFAYPAQRKDLDRVALAVANSFQPFPEPNLSAGVTSSPPEPPARPAAPAPPEPAAPSATALIVAPGRALTALKPDDCPNPSVGGKPAKIERTDAATGLVLLSGDFGAQVEPPARGASTADLVVLSADGARASVVPASPSGDGSRAVVAALEKSASGGPGFDRSGGLAGVVAPIAEEPKRVGGVALAVPHAMIDAEAIGAFLGGGALVPIAAPAPVPLSAGAIAAREKAAIAPVTCRQP
jgi:peptidoglycan hydrolase-like protein with peptidoglycan-binding domain